MDLITAAYAAFLGGTVVVVFLLNLIWRFRGPLRLLTTYLRLISIGGVSLPVAALTILVLTINVLFVSYRTTSAWQVKAGYLSLFNMLPLFLSSSYSLTSLLGTAHSTVVFIHRLFGWMFTLLLLAHITGSLIEEGTYPMSTWRNILTVMGTCAVGAAHLSSLPPIRRAFYEWFLWLHQASSAIVAVGTFYHISPKIEITRPQPLEIFLGIAALAVVYLTASHIIRLVYFNTGSFRWRSNSLIELQSEGSPIKVTIDLARPMHIRAGQFVAITIPSLSPLSFLQSHPFVVTSWTPGRQKSIELLIQPRNGFTSKLNSQTLQRGATSIVSGPFGASVSTWRFHNILMIANEYGIAAQIPYLRRLLGDSTSSRPQRVHLVWQTSRSDLIGLAAEWLLNSILRTDENRIISISIYMQSNLKDKVLRERYGRRARLYQGEISLSETLDRELDQNLFPLVQGDIGRRKVLIMSSVSRKMVKELRKLIRAKHRRSSRGVEISFEELDFQAE